MKTCLIFLISLIFSLPLFAQYNNIRNTDPQTDELYPMEFTGVNQSLFGGSISDAGDVNGDGYTDIIIGAAGFNNGIGRVYIFYGGEYMDSAPDVILNGEYSADYFGTSVSGAGDLNGDGYSDVIVGTSNYNLNQGKVYIYFGGAVMNNTVDLTIKGDSTTVSHFGRSVSSAGDVNNDGYSDVIVGAFVYGVNKGRAYIYYGGAVMNNIEDVVMTGEADNNYFGYCVSSAGDFNNDGYSDVIVSAIRNNSYTGKTYIFLGGASMDNIADVTMTGEAVSDYFGLAVSKAGDVNGDGISDVIVGAPYNSSFKGKAYIYYGGASVNNVTDVVLTGEAVNNFFGISLSGAGDVNNDGYDDVIIGAIGYSSYLGRAYIFNGGAVMSNVFDAAFTGTYPNYNYAGSVSSAGDVNNDGHSDLIVGSSHYYQSFHIWEKLIFIRVMILKLI